ncbi:MAG: DUF935 domain-containing protein, partial [Bacteroidota bacterium]|nr:DUF935 domain-containing protein [Bacteroidota bacterium]
FDSIEVVRREYVIPEKGIVIKNVGDQNGIDYTKKPWSDWVLPVGDKRDLGYLMKASPLIIRKKIVMVNWSEYCEVFGMPTRIGRTNIRDASARKNMEDMLRNMGSASWGVFDTEDALEMVDGARQDAFQVYDKLIERVNSEISKLILGQTMTTDNGSSRSQAEVHEDVSNEYGQADLKFIKYLVNDRLFPFLNNLGFNFNNLYFKWDISEKLSLFEKMAIDEKIMLNYTIPDKYITETYGTPVEKKEAPAPIPLKKVENYFSVIPEMKTIMPNV